MLVTVIVTLCHFGHYVGPRGCIERTVTQQATLMQCGGPMGVQVIPQWLRDEGYLARRYRLTKWGCVIGARKRISA